MRSRKFLYFTTVDIARLRCSREFVLLRSLVSSSFLQHSSAYFAVVYSLPLFSGIIRWEPFITGPCSVIREIHPFSSSRRRRRENRKNYSKNSPNARTERSVVVKYSEEPVAAREEETNARSRDVDMSITFVLLFPARVVEIFAPPPSPRLLLFRLELYLPLVTRLSRRVNRITLRLSRDIRRNWMLPEIRRLIVIICDVQKSKAPLDNDSKSLTCFTI